MEKVSGEAFLRLDSNSPSNIQSGTQSSCFWLWLRLASLARVGLESGVKSSSWEYPSVSHCFGGLNGDPPKMSMS